jgi:hypothetical protein
MTTSCLYHTQGTRGYKLRKTEYVTGTVIHYLHSKAKHLSCPQCGSLETSLVETGKTRDIRGLFIGKKKR